MEEFFDFLKERVARARIYAATGQDYARYSSNVDDHPDWDRSQELRGQPSAGLQVLDPLRDPGPRLIAGPPQ